MKTKRKRLTPICILHYVKLAYRTLLLVFAGVMYVISRAQGPDGLLGKFENMHFVFGAVWLVYAIEMAFRFFPSRLESMGCGKQFRRNFVPTEDSVPVLQSWKRTFSVAAVWLALNGAFGALYYAGIIDKGILILISLAYGVCDMICILFFCPFQTWFMKNRCCTVCRIYNWDFAMMFTPLLFVGGIYAWSLVVMSLVLLLRWEFTVRLRPERFSESTNACLSCKNCEEKLCHHKMQLRVFWRKNRKKFKFKLDK